MCVCMCVCVCVCVCVGVCVCVCVCVSVGVDTGAHISQSGAVHACKNVPTGKSSGSFLMVPRLAALRLKIKRTPGARRQHKLLR